MNVMAGKPLYLSLPFRKSFFILLNGIFSPSGYRKGSNHMIRNWFTMKKKEIALKLSLYTVIEKTAGERKGMAALLSGLYTALKDVPLDQLKDELLEKLAEIIHAQSEAEHNSTILPKDN